MLSRRIPHSYSCSNNPASSTSSSCCTTSINNSSAALEQHQQPGAEPGAGPKAGAAAYAVMDSVRSSAPGDEVFEEASGLNPRPSTALNLTGATIRDSSFPGEAGDESGAGVCVRKRGGGDGWCV